MPPDPKPAARVRDSELLAALHQEWKECALCGTTHQPLSLHHILKRSQGGDDVRENCTMLCGDGTRGEHGLVEARSRQTLLLLGKHLIEERHDTIEYLGQKLGGLIAVREWMLRQGLIV